MSWIPLVWSVAAGVCFGLAGLHFLVWLRSRESTASLLFSIAAIAAGATVLQEIFLLRAQTATEYGELLRWMHLSVAIIVIASVSFWLLEGALVQRYGLSLSIPFAGTTVAPMLAGLLAAGLVAGLLPAWRCYHRSLSDGLSPDVGG